MNEELTAILAAIGGAAGSLGLRELILNAQKQSYKRQDDKRKDADDKEELIQELRDRISQLEIDNAKKEAYLMVLKDKLEDGTLLDEINKLSDEAD